MLCTRGQTSVPSKQPVQTNAIYADKITVHAQVRDGIASRNSMTTQSLHAATDELWPSAVLVITVVGTSLVRRAYARHEDCLYVDHRPPNT